MSGTAEARALALAATQHGIVTRQQLLAAAFSSHHVEGWLARGLLRPMHAGVYRLGPVEAPLAPVMAAALACPGTFVSHRSAAVLWQLLPARAGEAVHVTGEARHHPQRQGIRAHRSNIHHKDRALLEGIPLTGPARTLLDLAAHVQARELEQAVAAADRAGCCTRDALIERVRRIPGHRGSRALRRLLDSGSAPAFTRSAAEDLLLAVIRSGGLPEPEWNVTVAGFEVDCYWRRERLAVEVDGYAFHGSARAFVRDRQRDSALAAAGIRVLRLSWHQLQRERTRTLVQLAQALARHP